MKRNPKRRTRLYKDQFVGPWDDYDHAEAIRAMPCCVSNDPAPSEPHHVKSRGAGGKWSDMVPMSPSVHRLIHTMGKTSFERAVMMDLTKIAAELSTAARTRRKQR